MPNTVELIQTELDDAIRIASSPMFRALRLEDPELEKYHEHVSRAKLMLV